MVGFPRILFIYLTDRARGPGGRRGPSPSAERFLQARQEGLGGQPRGRGPPWEWGDGTAGRRAPGLGRPGGLSLSQRFRLSAATCGPAGCWPSRGPIASLCAESPGDPAQPSAPPGWGPRGRETRVPRTRRGPLCSARRGPAPGGDRPRVPQRQGRGCGCSEGVSGACGGVVADVRRLSLSPVGVAPRVAWPAPTRPHPRETWCESGDPLGQSKSRVPCFGRLAGVSVLGTLSRSAGDRRRRGFELEKRPLRRRGVGAPRSAGAGTGSAQRRSAAFPAGGWGGPRCRGAARVCAPDAAEKTRPRPFVFLRRWPQVIPSGLG